MLPVPFVAALISCLCLCSAPHLWDRVLSPVLVASRHVVGTGREWGGINLIFVSLSSPTTMG